MNQPAATVGVRTWWHKATPYSTAELVLDGIIHTVGILGALAVGAALLYLATRTAPTELPAIGIYVASLLTVLTVSLAFNMCPVRPLKQLLARLDQAAIFLLIAGTYTPLLAIISGTPIGSMMMVWVWAGALVGVALKLIVPHHFGRLALLLYLGIGWSGVLAFQTLAETLPPSTLLLLLAGGLTYTAGILFHVWEKLRFQNALWHCFVVAGAMLHLWAILDCMVLHRL